MRISKNQFLLAILTLLSFLFAIACTDVVVDPAGNVNGSGVIDDTKVSARESFSYTVDLANQTRLKLDGVNGTISIESVTGTNRITISGEKIVGSDNYQDAKSHLKNLSVLVDELINEVQVKTLQPQHSNGRLYTVNYTIKVPSHLNMTVTNINGKINGSVSVPLNGTVEIALINGFIELDIPQNTSADFSANLLNGNISLQNLTLHNRIETLRSLHGKLGDGQGMISLKTTNGLIDVSGY